MVSHWHQANPDWQSGCSVLFLLVLDVDMEVGATHWHQYLEVGVEHQHPDQQFNYLVLSFLAFDVDVEVRATCQH